MKNILIIDDNPDDLEFYTYTIQQTGKDYKVFTAKNYVEAAAIFDSKYIDCTFIDYKLPGVNGLGILDEFQKQNVDKILPIIILTGYIDQSVQAEAARRGALDFLIKDETKNTPEQLDAMICKVIDWANDLNKKNFIS